jgi:hypothetical protein
MGDMRSYLAGVVLAAGIVISAGTAQAQTTLKSSDGLPSFQVANVADADLGKGWGDVQTDGATKYRAATKGGLRSFKVKAWWDFKSLRPPEDTIYLFTIEYKDTAKTPVTFAVYGGLGRGLAHVHRFGGTGDGKWKTANVPVSWDYLCRIIGDLEHTSIGFEAEEDLPVSAIVMRPATKADEEKYNAETRAWVATVQTKLAQSIPVKTEEPKFKVPESKIVAFPWSTMFILKQSDQPKTEQIGEPIKIRMCLNEIEGGSFGVYANGADLKGVDYKISELKGSAGILNGTIVRRTAEYCLVQSGAKGHEWQPQRLWPAYAVDIAKGRSHWFLFNIKTKRGETKPGLYKGEVTITAEGAKATLPVEVDVLPVDLLTMEEAGLSMGGCMTGLVPVHDIAFQTDYNQSGNNLWFSGVSPEMAIKDGKLVLDWTYLDEWMKGAKKRGMTSFVWFFGGDPNGFPRTLTLQRRLHELLLQSQGRNDAQPEFMKKMMSPEFREKIMPEIRPYYVDFFKQLYAHAVEANWPEVLVTPFDEPAKWVKSSKRNPDELGSGPWLKPQFKDDCAAIKEGAPKLNIYVSIHHNKAGEGVVYLPDVDVFCANCIHEDNALGDKVRAGGKTFWQYGGGNTIDSARYGFGYYFASFNSRGSLCWAYNWGVGFDTTAGNNWMYAWQTPFDTIPAPFFEGVREAWNDRRIIETYRKTFAKDAAAMAELDKILQASKQSYAGGGKDTVTDFWDCMDHPGKIIVWDNQLLDKLVKAKK